jgi:hypothetical protein
MTFKDALHIRKNGARRRLPSAYLNSLLDTLWVSSGMKKSFCINFPLIYILLSSYPIGVTLIQTLFSKILGSRPQGTW